MQFTPIELSVFVVIGLTLKSRDWEWLMNQLKYVPFSFQFVLAVGLNKRKFHLVGMSMGGFLAGIYAAKYSSLLSSLVLICPAGVKAPRLSEYIMEVANGRKNYLLPKNPDDFRFMLKKISHRDVFIPSFVINIMSAARQSAHEFYEKGKYLRANISVPL